MMPSYGTNGHSEVDVDPNTGIKATISTPHSSDPCNMRTVVWGTTVNIVESMAMFKNFLYYFKPSGVLENGLTQMQFEGYYCQKLKGLREIQDYNLDLDSEHLRSYEPSKKLYYQLLKYPQEIIPLMDHTLNEVINELIESTYPGFSCRVRPYNISERCIPLRNLEPSDIDQLVTIRGILTRTLPIMPDMKQAFFQCTICDQTVLVDNDRGCIIEPIVCPRDLCRAKNSMRLVHNRCVFSDRQVCRVQETVEETPDGKTPHTISICLYDDFVETLNAGDRVEVTGIYRATPLRVNPNRRTLHTIFKTFVDVVHARTTNSKRMCQDKTIQIENSSSEKFNSKLLETVLDEQAINEIKNLSKREDIYDLLTRSLAPSIFGMDDVKRGVLLQLFGGSSKLQNKPARSSTAKIRGDINILLVGDPGVSKSQLLQYVNKISSRGIYTSGRGSSAVGLTAYVTRDPETRQIVLESGALVLSDGGICCIDEFDKMTEYTRSVLHEVMEQQTISLAKAGIITTLNARTSILASANPVNSKFSEKLSVVENVNLPPTILSRFDLIYIILDKPDPVQDRALAQHILSFYLGDQTTENTDINNDTISTQLLARYISYAKIFVNPVISEGAGIDLIDYYVKMRNSGAHKNNNTISFTTRQLESTIRLAEAHARMSLSPVVTRDNVREANRLIVTALQTSAVDPVTGLIDLDLVNTGVSASHRIQHTQNIQLLKDYFSDLKQSHIKCTDAYEDFMKFNNLKIDYHTFSRLVHELVESGELTRKGLYSDVVLYKIQA